MLKKPLFPMTMEAQKFHYCALWKSTDFEAYTVMQSCTFWLFVFLSIDPTPLSLYSGLLRLLQMLLCSQVVTEKGKLYFMAVSAQLPLPSVSFCHFKKSTFTKKKKKGKNNNNKRLWHLPKASGTSYRRVSQGQLSSDASQNGDFQDAL